jgi:hypothetical protein
MLVETDLGSANELLGTAMFAFSNPGDRAVYPLAGRAQELEVWVVVVNWVVEPYGHSSF